MKSFLRPSKLAAMNALIFSVLSSLLAPLLLLDAVNPNPQITVMGMVYCDTCANNTFSRHSYFLPGVEVKIECVFKAISPGTTGQVSFSVNRTTNRYGIYKLEIPSIDGIECAKEKSVRNSCKASSVFSTSSACNVPGSRTASDEIAIKSRQANTCIYCLNALNFRPSRRNIALCGN